MTLHGNAWNVLRFDSNRLIESFVSFCLMNCTSVTLDRDGCCYLSYLSLSERRQLGSSTFRDNSESSKKKKKKKKDRPSISFPFFLSRKRKGFLLSSETRCFATTSRCILHFDSFRDPRHLCSFHRAGKNIPRSFLINRSIPLRTFLFWRVRTNANSALRVII